MYQEAFIPTSVLINLNPYFPITVLNIDILSIGVLTFVPVMVPAYASV